MIKYFDMILSFKTKINGKPTCFVEKIWKCLKNISPEEYSKITESVKPDEIIKPFKVDINVYHQVKPKIHTIREDKKNRWKPGVMIDFFINTRQPNMYRFAPRILVKSVQKVFMRFHRYNFQMSIEDRFIYLPEMEQIAINDGFENLEDFIKYFINQMDSNGCFSGKLIHWTDFKY